MRATPAPHRSFQRMPPRNRCAFERPRRLAPRKLNRLERVAAVTDWLIANLRDE
jgi:hypothetical protein